MRPATSTITTQGDLGGEKVALGFDPNSVRHIMSVLTDLYANPALAVIREYSTNALDANRAAGNPDPILVSLPNRLNPYFKVEDKGIGLSVDELRTIYSQYGASTKRDSDTQVGMLGLGCKSALTYTNQFTMTAVKDGWKAIVSISRDHSGGGTLEIVEVVETDDPNGVTVMIPTHDNDSFIRNARNFFRYWQPGDVLVDGKAPDGLEDAKLVAPDIYMVPSTASFTGGNDLLVMGNVAYPVDERLRGKYNRNYNARQRFSVVAFVPIGSFDFTPSREAVHYTKRSEALIAAINKKFTDAWQAEIQKDLNDQPTKTAAMQRQKWWWQNFGVSADDYRGETIPSALYVTNPGGSARPEPARQVLVYADPDTRGNSNRGHNLGSVSQLDFNRVPPSTSDTVVFVTGYPGTKLATLHRDKMAKLFVEKNIPAAIVHNGYKLGWRVFLTSAPFSNLEWLPQKSSLVHHITWDAIKKTRITQKAALPKDTLTYLQWTQLHYRTRGYTLALDDTKPTFWQDCHKEIPVSLFKYLPAGAQIVYVNEVRKAKFLRLHPKAKQLSLALSEHWDSRVARMTEADRIAYYGTIPLAFQRLDASRINDPDLSRQAANLGNFVEQGVRQLHKEISPYAHSYLTQPVSPPPVDKTYLDRYPLVKEASTIRDEHYRYINAVYQTYYKGATNGTSSV